MYRRLLSIAVLAVSCGGMALSSPSAWAHGRPTAVAPTEIAVKGDGARVMLDDNTVQPGRIRFNVETTHPVGSFIILFRLAHGVSLDAFTTDLQRALTFADPATAAEGTRALTRDARFYGLADVVAGHPASVTETLSPGTYHLIDLTDQFTRGVPVEATTLSVKGREQKAGWRDRRHGHGAGIWLTSDDRFEAPDVLPATGTVTVHNVSDSLHFTLIQPVREGTTDAEVQALFDSPPGPDPTLTGAPSVALDLLSPGRQAELSYSLPPGTYVLLCFVPDGETGIPHAALGMHKVVTLA
jgi:hypothetical protein